MYLKDIFADTFLPAISLMILGSSYSSLTAAFRIIFFYLLVFVAFFLWSNILAGKVINNLFLYHIFTPIEVIFVLLFLQKSFLPALKPRTVSFLSLFIIIASFINVLFFEELTTMDMNMKILSNFLITYMCLWGFFNVLKNADTVSIRISHFLFLFGIFIYSVSSIIIYSYFKYKNYQGKQLSNMLWHFHDNILIIKFTLFIIASYICTRMKYLK